MREIGALEARNRLGALLDAVERGEEIAITRRGTRVAHLVPCHPGADREQAREAARRIREMSHGRSLAGLALRDLIAEGRS
ncbi:MAG: type II toxin-antitoxin system prevent-host-death family antitoxin [Rhodospirillales bacterium]|nr:type II toxin-antitoxin system prevent-host-death family antitoxin [Rhodospirillales bacterium]